jgi:hypothetical protein
MVHQLLAPRRRAVLLIPLFAAATLTAILAGPATIARATQARTVTTYFINNTDEPIQVTYSDGTPALDQAPPADIAPGVVATWSSIGTDTSPVVGNVIGWKSSSGDGGHVSVSTGPPDATASCVVTQGTRPCSWVVDGSDWYAIKAYVRLGPAEDSRLGVTATPGQPLEGEPFDIKVVLKTEPDVRIPAGRITFTLDGGGLGAACTAVEVTAGTATCHVQFTTGGRHTVSASLTGSPRFADTTTSVPLDVTARTYPREWFDLTTGPGWEQRGELGTAPFTSLPGGVRLARLAISHDDNHFVAIGANNIVFHATRNLSTGVVSPFTVVAAPDGGPMGANAAAIDDQPNAPGLAQLAVVGLDQHVWHRVWRADGTWGAWSPTDPNLRAIDVGIGVDSTGAAQLVAAQASDGTVWHRMRSASGDWTPWATPAGYDGAPTLRASRVAVAVDRDGLAFNAMTLVMIGVDGRLYRVMRYPLTNSWSVVWRFNPLPDVARPAELAFTVGRATGTSWSFSDTGLLAVTGDNGTVYCSSRTGMLWNPFVSDQTPAGIANIAVSATPDTTGLNITTYK